MSDARNEFTPRIDYLKFVVSMDYDEGQRCMQGIIGRNAMMENPLVDRQDYRITILGPVASDPNKNRYCVESWGRNAVALAYCVPMHFWDSLNRIDYRAPMNTVNMESFEAFVTRRAMSKTGARNVTTFNTKNRQKSNTRDVGGRGITFGSRKSDSHTVAYAR